MGEAKILEWAAEREAGGEYVVKCPFCGREHRHSANEGHAIPHCQPGKAHSVKLGGVTYSPAKGYILRRPEAG